MTGSDPAHVGARGFTLHEQTVDVEHWLTACRAAFAGGARMLDFLTAVDQPGTGRIEVIAHLVDVDARTRQLVRTQVDRSAPRIDSLVGVYLGASWHERETAEMFGVQFVGNPDHRRLLTTGAVQHPLRRTVALEPRVDTPWPGATDPQPLAVPGTRTAARPRRPITPPGNPQEWSE